MKVKQVLDEAAVVAMTEADYNEDFYWDNVKLGVMVVACAFAMIAQFAPIPFPQSRLLLEICCAGYFIFSCVLQFIISFVDKDTIMYMKPRMEITGSSEKILLKSKFLRFEENYTLSIVLEENTPTKYKRSF